MCRGVSHTPFTAGMLHIRRGYFVRRYHSVFAHIRAYAIRPYTCSLEIMAKYGLYLPLFDGDTYKKKLPTTSQRRLGRKKTYFIK